MQVISRLVATMIVAVGAASVSFAGQSPIRVKVPFAFEAGGTTLPAGEYQVAESSSDILRITNLDTKRQILLSNTSGTSVGKTAGRSRLVFTRYGERYFLHQIYDGGTMCIHEYSGGKAERAARAAANAERSQAVVAAK